MRPNPPHPVPDAIKTLSRLAARPPLRTRPSKNHAGPRRPYATDFVSPFIQNRKLTLSPYAKRTM